MSFGAFRIFVIFSNLVSQKRLVIEQNGHKFMPQGHLFSVYGVLTVLLSIQGRSEVIQGNCRFFLLFKIFYLENSWSSSKTDPNLTLHGYLWLLSVQGLSEVIRYISDIIDFQQHCIVEWKGPKFGPRRQVFSAYRVILIFNCLRSFRGHSAYFRFSTILHLENGWS